VLLSCNRYFIGARHTGTQVMKFEPIEPFVEKHRFIYVCIYILDKALPRVLYGQYSPRAIFVSPPTFECYIICIAWAKGSALSGIENIRLEEIHSSETISNSPNSLEKQPSHSYWHCFHAGRYIPSLLGLISWVYRITCQCRTLGCSITTQYRTLAYIWHL